MKMPGLWLVGTEIFKWDIKRHSHTGTRRNDGQRRSYQGGVSAQGHRHTSPSNVRQNGAQQRQHTSTTRNYRYRYQDQQRLHDQYV